MCNFFSINVLRQRKYDAVLLAHESACAGHGDRLIPAAAAMADTSVCGGDSRL